jgi:L-lactate dehydrogenase
MKISIIGAGAVGSTIAYTTMIKNLASEIVLIDLNKEKQEGEVLDINDGLSFSESGKVIAGDYKDAKDSDIIILTAGVAQKQGETRLDLVFRNKEIAISIFKQIGEIKPSCIIVVVSNPVDIITNIVQEISGLPKNQVFGSGTCLDTARLRTIISEKFNISSEQVEGFMLGEHGDTEFVAWSTVSIEGKKATNLLSKEDMDSIENEIKNKAYNIISKKGATFYGIAMVVADIIEAIIFNQNKILPVSTQFDSMGDLCGNVCLGNPNIVGSGGIVKNWSIDITEEEKTKLKNSADTLKQYI